MFPVLSNATITFLLQPPDYDANQSVRATGGVYKKQGRIQRAVMTNAYYTFHVHARQFQIAIPTMTKIIQYTTQL